MTLTLHQWHQRYKQQACWTNSIRSYIYNRINISKAGSVLDIGCGTGVLLDEIKQMFQGKAFGVDIDLASIEFAHQLSPTAFLTQGNALSLPFRSHIFDISLCHFLLLWVNDPLRAIREMARIVRPGGYVLVMAEPDYGGRIDFPAELAQLGIWQTKALREQGADPFIGRELRSLLVSSGLTKIETGVLGGRWESDQSKNEIDLEWDILESDLSQNKEFLRSATKLKTLDKSAWINQRRILFVPTFYALGIVAA
jgi:SAM-dependent methyltransferase